MWARYLHHLSLHVPIVLIPAVAAVGTYHHFVGGERVLRIVRWAGWGAFLATAVAVLSGALGAPAGFAGEPYAALRHHRDLALTTLAVAGLAVWAFEKGVRRDHADWRAFAVGVWWVAALGVVGTAHWSGATVHADSVPWIEGQKAEGRRLKEEG
ncbi:MAG: hypothetical protein ABEL76_08370 [Bradymonadaceae bacterium]